MLGLLMKMISVSNVENKNSKMGIPILQIRCINLRLQHIIVRGLHQSVSRLILEKVSLAAYTHHIHISLNGVVEDLLEADHLILNERDKKDSALKIFLPSTPQGKIASGSGTPRDADGVSGFGIGKVVLSTFEVLQMLGFFLQMGFTLILATLDGLDVGLLGDVIGEDDCDEDE
ncbi:hypothetical protein Tco_0019544 [Tanacetum coccineum]